MLLFRIFFLANFRNIRNFLHSPTVGRSLIATEFEINNKLNSGFIQFFHKILNNIVRNDPLQ